MSIEKFAIIFVLLLKLNIRLLKGYHEFFMNSKMKNVYSIINKSKDY